MKRLISVLLVLAMCVSVLNVFAQNDTSEMENALLSVKQKIDIPSEAEKFESVETLKQQLQKDIHRVIYGN